MGDIRAKMLTTIIVARKATFKQLGRLEIYNSQESFRTLRKFVAFGAIHLLIYDCVNGNHSDVSHIL